MNVSAHIAQQDMVLEIERLQFALEAAGVGTWDYDLQTGQAEWSAICKQLFGLPPDAQVTVASLMEQVHPDDRERVGQANLAALNPAGDGQHDIIFRTLTAHGHARWVQAKGRTIKDQNGQVTRFSGIIQEVTQQITTRQAVEASEAKLRSIIATAPAAMGLFVGRDLVVELPNQTFIDIVGKGPDIVGKPLREVMPELITENQPFLQILDQVYTSGQMFQSFGSLVKIVQQGVMTHNYYNITYTPLRDERGEVYAILDIAIDVTEEVKARQQLQESELFSRNLIADSPVAIVVFEGDDMVIRTVNDNMLNMLGRDASIIGKAFMEVMPELKATPLMDRLRHVLATGETYVQPEEKITLIKQGEPYIGYYNYIYQALRNTAGEIYGVTTTANEVTPLVMARLKAEESEARYRDLSAQLDEQVQLRTRELQALIGDLQRSNQNLEQFAYIASHDLQEPLRKIQSFSNILEEKYGPVLGQEGMAYLSRLTKAGARMSTLIRDLLAFSRISTQQVRLRQVSLLDVVQQALENLSVAVDESQAQITLGELPVIQGDAMQLGQLFQNLLSNALKFRRAGVSPHIQVEAYRVQLADLPTDIQPTRSRAAYWCVRVSDNGIGFDDKYTDRIFQVFQRLHGKDEFSGTGVGLAICQKVVANHGGNLTAYSRPGQGATFVCYLPE